MGAAVGGVLITALAVGIGYFLYNKLTKKKV